MREESHVHWATWPAHVSKHKIKWQCVLTEGLVGRQPLWRGTYWGPDSPTYKNKWFRDSPIMQPWLCCHRIEQSKGYDWLVTWLTGNVGREERQQLWQKHTIQNYHYKYLRYVLFQTIHLFSLSFSNPSLPLTHTYTPLFTMYTPLISHIHWWNSHTHKRLLFK